MVALPKRRTMTVAEFLAWEDRQPERHEFLDGDIVAMVGGTVAHNQIAGNVDRALAAHLRGTPCRAFREGLRIVTDSAVFYPDVFVTCTRLSDQDRMVQEPTVIIEVLSESTEQHDRVFKSRAYRTLPSLRQYVLIDQKAVFVESFVKTDRGWVHEPLEGLDGVLLLPSLGIELPLATLYEDTDLLAEARAANG